MKQKMKFTKEQNKEIEVLIEDNRKLINSIINKYSKHNTNNCDDLYQEAIFGIMTAYEKFDESKNVKFSTYATWWIRQSITRSLANKSRTIRIPFHSLRDMNKIRKAKKNLNNKTASDEEISEKSDLPLKKIRKLNLVDEYEPISFSLPLGSEEDLTIEDTIADDTQIDSFNYIIKNELFNKIQEMLSILNPKEEKIIRMRFGLGEKHEFILEDIAKEFMVTRERIRKIEIVALQKLKQSKYARLLLQYMSND